ncbi:MAB_1171c family putative transporter [Actinoalloteichus spitiensis]|uniref:MAB_1171c family putative transporter n=1 Tax=Actinoalloteichus spitiensis TaxID=252394 RepID=UPI0003769E25|nr:MAB_1171c family putative transporter [Actinoalloteichus spitiensis]
MRDVVQLAVIGLAVSASVLKLLHLRRPGTNRSAIRAMCGFLVAMGAALVMESAAVSPWLDQVLGMAAAYALKHTAVLTSLFCLRAAFLCWVWEPGRPRTRRLLVHGVVLLGVLLLRWVLGLLAGDADVAAAMRSEWTEAPWSAAAMILYALYVGLSGASIAVLAVLWARHSDRRWTARGLRLIALGCVVGISYLAHKVVFLALVLGGWQPTYDQYQVEWMLIVCCAALLFAGLAMPLIATGLPAAVRLGRHRAAYGRLGPLWMALTRVRPEVVLAMPQPFVLRYLPAPVGRLWDRVSLGNLSLRLYHRVIECWDVLVYLHGHLSDTIRSEAYERAYAETGDAHQAAAISEAVMIAVALRRAEGDHPVLPEGERARPMDSHHTLSENIAWWQRVSHAYRSPLTAHLAERYQRVSAPV